jgi:uncharacterized damage-inducible protein DinB
MEKEEIFERLNHCRRVLLDTLDKIPPDELDSALVEGNWTIKEILCHLTAWELTVLDPLVAFVQVDEFKPEIIDDHDVWNAEQTAKRQAMTLQLVLEELQATRELLVSEASLLTDEQWERTLPAPWGGQGCIANLLNGLVWHENEHLQTIHAWCQKQLRSE